MLPSALRPLRQATAAQRRLIDWASPLTSGLVHAWAFTHPFLWDVVTQRGAGPINNVLGRASALGPAADAADATSYWSLGNEGAAGVWLPTTMFTFACLRECADTTARASQLFGTGSTTTIINCNAPYSDGKMYFNFGGNTGDNSSGGITMTKTTALEAWVFIAGQRGLSVWRDGVLVTSKTVAISRSAGTSAVVLNFFGGGADIQTLHLALVLNAEWTPTQVVQWTAAPFSVFAPARRALGVLPVAGAPPAPPRTSMLLLGVG